MTTDFIDPCWNILFVTVYWLQNKGGGSIRKISRWVILPPVLLCELLDLFTKEKKII